MAVKTTQQRLEEVQAAITNVLLNQSYRLGDRTVTRADLAALEAMEKRLLLQYNREQGTKPLLVGSRFDGMGYPAAGETSAENDGTGTIVVLQTGS